MDARGGPPGPRSVTFGRFELDMVRAILKRDGKVCDIEPKALAVLIYLVRNRDRVVPRTELLERIWRSSHFSEGVVSQVMMKLRRAIPGEGGSTSPIRTIHGVGYRFQAEVQPVPEAASHAPSPPAVFGDIGRNSERIVFLPFENATQAPELAWIELGLMALAAGNVDANGLCAAVLPAEVLAAIPTDRSAYDLAELAALLFDRLGVRRVVGARVTRLGHEFRLQWDLLEQGRRSVQGAQLGSQLAPLTLEMSEAVARLVAGVAELADYHRASFGDPFLDEAYSRAMHEAIHQNYRDALMFLEVCRMSTSCPAEAKVAHVRLLSLLDDSGVTNFATPLLEELERSNNRLLTARVLESLALHHSDRGELKVAAQLGARAIALLRGEDRPDDLAGTLINVGSVALYQHQIEAARSLFEEADRIAAQLGNRMSGLKAVGSLGNAEFEQGNLDVARIHYDRALSLARLCAQPLATARTLANLALIEAEMGRLRKANRLLEEAVGLASERGSTSFVAHVKRIACMNSINAGDIVAAEAAAALLGQAPLNDTAAGRGGAAHCAGLLAWRRADLTLAREVLALGRAELRPLAPHWMPTLIVQHIAFAVCAGDFGTAQELISELESAPAYQRSRRLRGAGYLCRSWTAHAEGDGDDARRLMDWALENLHMGELYGWAVQGAVWLACEAGTPERVGALLAERPIAASEHCADRLVLARLAHARGEFEEALRCQRAYLAATPLGVNRYVAQLHALYERSARSGTMLQVPRVPNLLLLW